MSATSLPVTHAAPSPSLSTTLPHTGAQGQKERVCGTSVMLRPSAVEAVQAEVAHGEEVARQAAVALAEKLSSMPRSDSFEIYYKDNGCKISGYLFSTRIVTYILFVCLCAG